jgi:negative regulator of flagellin synthesis FlgM
MMIVNDPAKPTRGSSLDIVTNDKSSAPKLDPATSGISPSKLAEPVAASSAAGNVTISPMSSKLLQLEAAVKSSNVFDIEKVDAIKTAISAGQFQVNTAKVAAGLIATVTDLLTTQKS